MEMGLTMDINALVGFIWAELKPICVRTISIKVVVVMWKAVNSDSCSSYGTGYGVPHLFNPILVGIHRDRVGILAMVDRVRHGRVLVQSHNQGNVQDVNHFQQDHSGHGSSLDAICREGKVKTAVEINKSWRNEGYIW